MESVAIYRWPRDADRRGEFASTRTPCLWIVDPDAAPPQVEAWEDWIRLPADEFDTVSRLRNLAQFCRPVLVDDAVLRNSVGSVALPASEALIVNALLASPGTLVARKDLEIALWPQGPPRHRALDDLVYRLRRRLKPLHLDIVGHRGGGFALGVAREPSTRD